MLDPVKFAEHVLQPIQEQLVTKGLFESGADTSPDELVATALGTWLANKFSSGSSPADEAGGDFDGDSTSHQDLVDRDRVLAAALGACHCWGQNIDCGICQGVGTPGWKTPDQQLYIEYVKPAVRATTRNYDTANPPE
jgi:hypothetical protein